jgi:hypothetical protein
MAQINMNGRQSFLLNDIKMVIRNGGNVTHILNVKVSNEQENGKGNSIRQEIFRRIQGKPIVKMVNGREVDITWMSSASKSSSYYYANVTDFTDTVVKQHTKLLLQDLLVELDPLFDQVFTKRLTGLAFLVTLPLTRRVALDIDND